jgi:hypothetical protein
LSLPHFQAPDLTETNAALAKAFSHIQGLKLYSDAEIREIKAAAWAEGHAVGRNDEWSVEVNPYRG